MVNIHHRQDHTRFIQTFFSSLSQLRIIVELRVPYLFIFCVPQKKNEEEEVLYRSKFFDIFLFVLYVQMI